MGGALVFLTIAGGFFGFMLTLAFLPARIRARRRVRDYGWPIETDIPVPFFDVLLRLIWGVIIFAALIACAFATLAVVVASLPLIFGYRLTLPEAVRGLLTIELIASIVIGASLVVGLALFISVLIAELISERKSPSLDELHEHPAWHAEERS